MDRPTGLSKRARSFWTYVTDSFEIEENKLITLQECVKTMSILDAIADGLKGQPLTSRNRHGEIVAHPLLREQRSQQAALSALLKALDVPDEDGQSTQRGPGAPRKAVNTRGTGYREAL